MTRNSSYFPFFIVGIRRIGRLYLQGTRVAMCNDEASRHLDYCSKYVNQLVGESPGNEVELVFLAKQKLVDLSNITSFELNGGNVSGLPVV